MESYPSCRPLAQLEAAGLVEGRGWVVEEGRAVDWEKAEVSAKEVG